MLQSIRDGLHKHKWLGYVVLGALALVFAAWGAYGIVNVNFGGTNYAADADGQKIPLEAARNAWVREQAQYQQQLGGEIPAPQKALLQDQLLESLIRDALLTERAHHLGYRVTEAELREAVRNEPAFQIEGVYSAEVAKERLAQAGISLDAFQDELRGALQRAQIENGIAISDFQTPTEVQRARALRNEERQVRYVVISPEKYAAEVHVDDAGVQAYYKAHQAQYMTPEFAKLQYAELRLDQLEAQMTPTDADLRTAYEKNKERYVVAEKRHAQHILIPIGKDEAAAKKLAEDVLAQAKAGKDFAALAKKYSQDPGSADKGGDLGWADRNQFVGPFADALFSMSVGEIRGPVKSQFGYHIIKLDEIQPGKVKSFEEARPELEAEVRRNQAADRFGEIQEQLQSKIDQSGSDLDTLAREFKLQSGDIPQFVRGAGAAPLGAAPAIQELVFGDTALPAGKIGGPVTVGEDRLVLVKVLERHKPEPKPLTAVHDAIVAAIRKQRGSEAALQAAQGGQKQLASGTPFDEVAKSLGVTADPPRFVGRSDPSVPAQLRAAVFDSPKPTDQPVYQAVPLQSGSAALVAILMVRTEGAPVAKEQQEAQIKQQAQQAKQDAARAGRSDVEAYLAEVRRTADVQKNPKAFE